MRMKNDCSFHFSTERSDTTTGSHTLFSGFHYETYIGISPYRTLAVAGTAMHDSYVIRDLIV